jgi:hypothetical protein
MRSRHSLAIGLATVLATLVSQQSPPLAQTAGGVSPNDPTINPPVANCNVTPDSVKGSDGQLKRTEMDKEAKERLLTSGQPCQQVVTTVGLFGDDSLANRQRGFDFYSWLTFIAMNSPADGKTTIGKGNRPGGDAKTKWEDLQNYRPLADVMLPGGAKPEWGKRIVPEACKKFDSSDKIIFQLGEEAFNQPFKTGPLIDQDGNYALFDILMNEPMYRYIEANELYSKAGQQKFAGQVEFPTGTNPPKDNSAPGHMGAIMLKVSYRILDPVKNKDLIPKFHTSDALIYFPGGKDKTGTGTMAGPDCVEKKLGLIGFHVGHKTKFAPQWVWTSFEHVSNVPTAEEIAAKKLLPRYSFFSAKCSEADCPRNEIPPRPWDPPTSLQFPTKFRSQVVRINMVPAPVLAEVAKLNKSFQGILKGSVWENYMLLTTQWPSDFASKTDPTGAPAPIYLANSTLETFSQGTIPLASSSCMACHGNAVSFQPDRAGTFPDNKGFSQSDFTFILEKAQ